MVSQTIAILPLYVTIFSMFSSFSSQLPPSVELHKTIERLFLDIPNTLLENQELLDNGIRLEAARRPYVDKEWYLAHPEGLSGLIRLAGSIELAVAFRGVTKARPEIIYKWPHDASLYEFTVQIESQDSPFEHEDPAFSVMTGVEIPPFVAMDEDHITNACVIEAEQRRLDGRSDYNQFGRVTAYLGQLQNQGSSPDFLSEAECMNLIDFTENARNQFFEKISAFES